MKPKETQFIIIDDDLTCIELCKIAINNSFDTSVIHTFSEAERGLYHLMTNYDKVAEYKNTVLFLDLNMAFMNGWSFIECFSLLDEKIKSQINIVILSSSEDPEDKARAAQNIHVSDYIEKELLYDGLYFVLAKYCIAA